MIASERIERAARRMLDDQRSLVALGAFPQELRPRTVAEATEMQDALLALLVAGGPAGALGGWKIGLTSRVMQEMWGIDRPVEGAMPARLLRPSPATVRAAEFRSLAVESEIAVRIGRDLPVEDGPYDRETVGRAVAACMAAIEVVDTRAVIGTGLDAMMLIADNAMTRGCVLGPEVTGWRSLDLATLAGRMEINGAVVASGVGDDALGHPLNAVAWLANRLGERGRRLRAGDIVMTGSIVKTRPLAAGDEMATVIDGLGEARLRVE